MAKGEVLGFARGVKSQILTVYDHVDRAPIYPCTTSFPVHRLLNLGIEVAPSGCTNIVILDCDILFLNDMWITHTLEALRTAFVVQPFSTSYRMMAADKLTDLPRDSGAERIFSQAYAVGMGEGQVGRDTHSPEHRTEKPSIRARTLQVMHGAAMGTAAVICLQDDGLTRRCTGHRVRADQILATLRTARGRKAKALLDRNSNIRGHPG